MVSDTCGDWCPAGECSVGTFAVISMPETCSKYICMFTFRMFANKFLLSNAYNHSKQTLDFMQITIVKIVKRKTSYLFESVAYGQVICTQER